MSETRFDPFGGVEQPVDWDAVEAAELRGEEDAERKAELERDRRYVEGLV
ncbi:hypothetical protein [uncultured Bifidobacterium sp.]|nr:hypothetical protein [uncultured Bifidobacterium sp.]